MAKKRKRKLKKSVKKGFLLIVVLALLVVGYKDFKTYQYHQSYEYKLLELTYTPNEAKILTDKLSDDELDNILKREHDKNIPSLVNEKYFMFKNLDRYIKYISKNLKEEKKTVISFINVNRDRDYYEEMTPTDTSLGVKLLCNKYHNLTSDYEVDNLVNVSSTYGYGTNKLNEEAYDAFKSLADDAKKEGYTILIVSAYRSFDRQDELWKERKESYGIRKADQYAARAGSSEHETGYAIDVADYYDENDAFGQTEAYGWMLNNSYKYGYILRYPKSSEEITGYSYEAWHYRYVGVETACAIHKENITFDEYYEFYLNK